MNITGLIVFPDGLSLACSPKVEPRNKGFTWGRFGSTLGVHVYAKGVGSDLIVGVLRVNNGVVKRDGTGFCGEVYYNSIQFAAPAGWEWVTLPQAGEQSFSGTWIWAGKPAEGSHWFPARAILERPFALVRAGKSKAKAQGLLRYAGARIPDPVKGYGPGACRQPKVDRAMYASVCAERATKLLGAQFGGAPLNLGYAADIQGPAMGPFWLDGAPPAWMHGGFGIDPSHGYEQVPEALLCHAILARANMARQFCAAYDADTGRPISLYDWTVRPDRQLMKGEPGRQGETELVCFMQGGYDDYRYKRFNSGTCAYESKLREYRGHDVAHGIRLMRHLIPLCHTGEQWAIDDLAMACEDWRYQTWSDRPDEKAVESYPGEWLPTTLAKSMHLVSKNPHKGGWLDRNYAWMCYGGAACHTYGVPGWLEWGKKMLALGLLAADKWGFTMREKRDELPSNCTGIITFHEGLNAVGMYALERACYGRARPEMGALLELKVRSLYGYLPAKPYQPGNPDTGWGPPHWIATTRDGKELAELEGYGPGDPTHVLAACSAAHRANPNDEFLSLALEHWKPHDTLEARRAWLEEKEDLAWCGDYLRDIQALLG